MAIVAIYEHRTFRLPPVELLRVALGLWLPVMLIGHAITTRLEYELVGAPSTYARIISDLWARDGEWQHMGLLAPGWLHGSLGLHFAFGRQPMWRRHRFLLFAVALLLPVLSALGFMEMGRELARRQSVTGPATTTQPSAEVTNASAAGGIVVDRWRAGLFWGILGIIGLAFTARGARNFVEHCRDNLVAIAYPSQTVRVPRGWSVLETSRAFRIPHVSSCGGRARCSTCRVKIVEGEESCPPPRADEAATLQHIKAEPDVRLACQLRPHGDISIVPLLRPDQPVHRQTVAPLDADRDVVIVLCQFSNRAALERDHLAHDVLFVFTRYAENACSAVHNCGGVISYVGHDCICAVFGLHGSLSRASRQALATTYEIGQALGKLNAGLDHRWGCKANIVVSVHAGFAALRHVGQGVETVIAAGPALEVAEELGAQALRIEKAFAISGAVFELAKAKVPQDEVLAVDLTKAGSTIRAYALDAIPDYLAGGRARWRKKIDYALQFAKTIIES